MSAVLTTPPPLAPTRATQVRNDGTLTLTMGGKNLIGWQRMSLTRAMESVPATFALEVTERYPSTPDADVRPGQPCTVQIGADLVLTGYVDRYTTTLGPGTHTVRVEGRSKSEDLVDCSAFFGRADAATFQMSNTTVLAIARALAQPYGITINAPNAPPWEVIPQFNILPTETCWDIIDRLTRWAGLIAYDMPDGSVILAVSGSEQMASGVAVGGNIEGAEVALSMDGRFSDYEARLLATDTLGTEVGLNNPLKGKVVKDDGVPRFRKRYVISEQFVMGESIAEKRAVWEMNRNKGRSMALNCTIDTWRDQKGALWAPNHLAPIDARQLKVPNDRPWIIASVTYTRDENGQRAALVLMPPEAFLPEPAGPLYPLPPLIQDLERNNPVKPGPRSDAPDRTAPYVGPGTA
jgi:prophage tail gpP-like protein